MIIRRQENPRGWTVLPNAFLEDEKLSYRARGLQGYLLSRPDGWETDSTRLARKAKEGRDAVRTALSELEACGYLIRSRVQGAKGRWTTLTWIFDHPATPEERAEIEATPGVHKPVDKSGDELW